MEKGQSRDESRQWRAVVGYEGLYEVSDDGLVRGVPRKFQPDGGLLALRVRPDGYCTIILSNGADEAHSKYVHRLVCETFIGSPASPDLHVNHRDGNPRNNALSNLEWCTASENRLHSIRELQHLRKVPHTGGRYWAGKQGKEAARSKPVICTLPTGIERSYESVSATAKDGYVPETVSLVARGLRPSYKGCKWRFESEAVTAPVLAQALAAQQARPVTPTNHRLDMPAVHAWFAEQAGKPGTPMTPKEMERWDEKSRAAWSGLQS